MSVILLSIDVVTIGETLDTARETLVSTHLSTFSSIGRAIGAIGALLYIAYRVWGHMARAEAIDVFPLLRPFALGLVIINFGVFTGFLDSMVDIISNQTQNIVEGSTDALEVKYKEYNKVLGDELFKRDLSFFGFNPDEVYNQDNRNQEGDFLDTIKYAVVGLLEKINRLGADVGTFFESLIHKCVGWCMQFGTVAIDTVSTFFLIVLTLLGPIVFGIACFDGFGHIISNWVSRYISISLWVPISHILHYLMNQIEMNLVQADIASYQAVQTVASSWIFIVFYIMGIIAYFTVPTIAGWVVDAGSGAGALLSKTTGLAMMPVNVAVGAAGAALGGAAGAMITNRIGKVSSGNNAPQG